MAKAFSKSFYNSKAWQTCRDSFIAYRVSVDGGLCQRCHERYGYIIHHKDELSPSNVTDPDVALNHNNLQYVCHDCHNIIHGRGSETRVEFDSNGNVIPKQKRDPPSKI